MKLVLGRQNPTFSVVAVQLRADITYSKATVSVIIDERGLNKYARDYINEVDELYLGIGKGLIDYPDAIAAITELAISKRVSDDCGAADIVSIMVGFSRAYTDSVSTSDQITSKTAVKVIADTLAALDAASYSLSKQLADSVLVVDNADANSGDGLEYTDVKPSSDQVGASDLAIADLEKALTETIALTELLQQVFAKALTDAVVVSELALLELGRPLADSTTATEQLDRLFNAVRAYSDSVSQSETLAFGSTKPIADTSTPTDSFDRVFTANLAPADNQLVADSYVFDSTKPLADSTAASEVFDRVFAANRTASDSALTLDVLASIDVSKLLTDAANAVSSGSLRMTDYADITYFAEDYVGSTRTFS